jgi:hypothetical protein
MSQSSFNFPNQNTVTGALTSPVARAADPKPSKLAAAEITASGRREGQLLAVLALVKKFPRSTSLELSRHSSLDRYVVARRLPELAHAGLVAKRSVRQCVVGHRPATTWEAI